jgi:hypothetical protein
MFIKRLSFCLLVAASLIGVSPVLAQDSDEYVESVVLILRTHTQLMETIAQGPRFRYSDNLVRHAQQIRETFGLVGPMEWHAAQAVDLSYGEDDSALSEEQFESLALASQRSLTNLVRAAHDSMERYDNEGMLEAIAAMKQSCMNCHSLLPESIAPRVWDTPQGE